MFSNLKLIKQTYRLLQSNYVDNIRNLIADCIPYIRFSNISPKDFSEKVIPYDELLPRELHRAILNYHLTKKDYSSSIPRLPPRKGQIPDIDSVIIDKQQA